MKLLKKSIVNIEVANERKNQIDEGIKLAQKIDVLRQTLGSLEDQHSKFILQITVEAREKTSELDREISQRKLEIGDLMQKRIELLEPLDSEWQKLKEKSEELESVKVLIQKGMDNLSLREGKTEENYTKSKNTLNRVNSRERELIKVYDKAKLDEELKVKYLEDAKKIHTDATKHFTDKNKELLDREAVIAVREREIGISFQGIESERKEIEVTKIQLADQRKTLERALERINKK